MREASCWGPWSAGGWGDGIAQGQARDWAGIGTLQTAEPASSTALKKGQRARPVSSLQWEGLGGWGTTVRSLG